MSEQEVVPEWHAIVGDGWEPVRFGEETRRDDEVLRAGGWVKADYVAITTYRDCMMPRRRRQSSYEILVIKDGADYCRMRAVKPKECFMVMEDGSLIPVDKPPTESAE